MSQQQIIFNGSNGLPSDALIRLVRLRSLEAGKETDDRWIAIAASACFEGNALEWYEDKPEDTQESWRLLRRAILRQWPPGGSKAVTEIAEAFANVTLEPNSGSIIPTPAAAPPPVTSRRESSESVPNHLPLSSDPKIGPIRVNERTGRHLGYICRTQGEENNYNMTGDPSDALVVKFTPSQTGSHDIVVAESPLKGLGIACGRSTLLTVSRMLAKGELIWITISGLEKKRTSELSLGIVIAGEKRRDTLFNLEHNG